MRLEEYQVWHTYGTYFLAPFTSGLEQVAERLVASRMAVTAITSSGQVFAWDGEGVTQAPIKMQATSDNRRAEFECSLLARGDYAAETIYQFAWMAFAEMRVTSSLLQEHAPYVRAFIDPVRIANDDVSVLLYPQLKLYENGVILLQLRLFSPPGGTSIESLVEDFVNLPWMAIDSIEVPPTLLSLFGVAHIHSAYSRWWQRRKAKRLALEQAAVHISRAETRNFGDFDFELVDVPVDAYETEEVRRFEFVRDLFLAPLALLLAEREIFREAGSFWGSRPSVFLTRFNRQPDSFPEVDPKLRRALVPILMRSPEVEANVAGRFPFKNLRLFDDYLWVIGDAVTLCVFSRKAHRTDEEFRDPNQGNLVYEKIVIGEAMEFLRYSHHRVLQVTSSPKSSPEEALDDWRTIADIESVIRSPSNFGEISDAVRYFEQTFRLGDMRTRALQALEIQRIRAAEKRGYRLTLLGIVIAVVFGLGSVTSIRGAFIVPLLSLLGVKADSTSAGELLWQSLGTLAFMFLIASVTWVLIAYTRSRRMRRRRG